MKKLIWMIISLISAVLFYSNAFATPPGDPHQQKVPASTGIGDSLDTPFTVQLISTI